MALVSAKTQTLFKLRAEVTQENTFGNSIDPPRILCRSGMRDRTLRIHAQSIPALRLYCEQTVFARMMFMRRTQVQISKGYDVSNERVIAFDLVLPKR